MPAVVARRHYALNSARNCRTLPRTRGDTSARAKVCRPRTRPFGGTPKGSNFETHRLGEEGLSEGRDLSSLRERFLVDVKRV